MLINKQLIKDMISEVELIMRIGDFIGNHMWKINNGSYWYI